MEIINPMIKFHNTLMTPMTFKETFFNSTSTLPKTLSLRKEVISGA